MGVLGALGKALLEIRSPSAVMRSDPAAFELFNRALTSDLGKKVYLEMAHDALSTGVKIPDNSPKMGLVGEMLDRGVQPGVLDQLPNDIKQTYQTFKTEYSKRADELGLPMNQRITNYLTHTFDPTELGSDIQDSLNNAVATGASQSEIERLTQSLKDVRGGVIPTYDKLPQDIKFKYFEQRTGKAGYSLDAMKAYKTYLFATARKLYDSDFLRSANDLIPQIKDNDLRDYAKWYTRDYLGYEKYGSSFGRKLSSAIRNFEFARTIGLNPRSPIINATQSLSTAAEIGPTNFMAGVTLYHTPEGQQLLNQSGHLLGFDTLHSLAGEVQNPTAQKLLSYAGFLFNEVEKRNRGFAYLGGLSQHLGGPDEVVNAMKSGGIGDDAIRAANDVVRRTQGIYGKVDQPRFFRSPLGSVIGQFNVTPIKILEGIIENVQNGNFKMPLGLLGAGYVGNKALNDLLDVDLSDALGPGVDVGHLLIGLGKASQQDWQTAKEELAKALATGSGVLPTFAGRFGPGAEAYLDLGKIAKSGIDIATGRASLQGELPKLEQLTENALAPIPAVRVMQAFADYKNGGSPREFVQAVVGVPQAETVVRRAFLGNVERGDFKQARELRRMWMAFKHQDLTVDPAAVKDALAEHAKRRQVLNATQNQKIEGYQIQPYVYRRMF